MAIDVGSSSESRGSYQYIYNSGSKYTAIDYNNAANATGALSQVNIYCTSDYGGTEVVRAGTFTDNGSASFTCNDGETLGNLTGGQDNEFTGLDIDVTSGEFIGCDCTSGDYRVRIARDTSGGSGVYYIEATNCDPSDEDTYTLGASDILSLYGQGAEAGWSNIAKAFGVAAADIAKINGVAVADIAKVSGVAV